jgi:transglutaminase-like putative cysteine protease
LKQVLENKLIESPLEQIVYFCQYLNKIKDMNILPIFKLIFCACIVFLCCWQVGAQGHGFAFGKITYPELEMKKYDRDTSAVALVLNEFGEAYFDSENLNLIRLEYHIKIKILKEAGKEYADFIIPMRRSGSSRQELVRNIKASSFNLVSGSWKESALSPKAVFTEKSNEDYWLTKFAVPDVRVGSVIEVYYELETPYTEIPKVRSEFWARYPAHYEYGITLKGFLKLNKDEGEVVKQCTTYADCTLLKYAMEYIPAFKEEDFMTAKKNYLSAITFELAKITQSDGRVDKVTTEWKDAVQELKQHDKFGAQIKRARGSFDEQIAAIRAREKVPLAVANAIYNHIKSVFQWNGDQYFLAENGVKKALETGKGNVGDINLSLLGALQAADLQAEPVLLSTRANGIRSNITPCSAISTTLSCA